MKKLLAQVALTLAVAAPAFAWANSPGASSTSGPDGGSFNDSSLTGGAFDDTFALDLVAGQGGWVITSTSFGNYDISGFTIALTEGGKVIPGSYTSSIATLIPGTPITVTAWTEVFNNLAAGDYSLNFSGTFGTSGGGYGGTFTLVPAVPEPSTWVAMLVGLGLMLTVARKRQFHL